MKKARNKKYQGPKYVAKNPMSTFLGGLSGDHKEHWRPIPGYENSYAVSKMGEVRSFLGPGRFLPGGHLLKNIRRKIGGYLQVTLCKPGEKTVFQIHTLVLLAFVGPRPEGQQGCHGDGDPGNNALSNLRWGTPLENRHDSIAHGTLACGERHGRSKLSREQVEAIRAAVAPDTVRLAQEYAVSRHTITRIRAGTRWAASIKTDKLERVAA